MSWDWIEEGRNRPGGFNELARRFNESISTTTEGNNDNAARPVVQQLAAALGLEVMHHHGPNTMTYAGPLPACDLFHDTLALMAGVDTGAVFWTGRIVVSFDPAPLEVTT